jgi:hypothetical protein
VLDIQSSTGSTMSTSTWFNNISFINV